MNFILSKIERKINLLQSFNKTEELRVLYQARYEYLHDVITKTIKEMLRIRDHINYALYIRHGCHFLNAAYEEVMCPGYFTSKKRYCGLPHVKSPMLNIRLKELSIDKLKKVLLIKGLDIIKQGHAALTTETGRILLAELMDPFSYSNLMNIEPVDVVMKELHRINNEVYWNDPSNFIL